MDNLYTVLQISNRYGVKVGTVRSWIKQKILPAIKIGKEYRISETDIREFETARKTTKREDI